MNSILQISLMGLLVVAGTAICPAQTKSVAIQAPTGVYPVGTVTYEWTDDLRPFSYSTYGGDKRTIPVQLWYPAHEDPQSTKAPYSSFSNIYSHAASNSSILTAFNKKIEKSPLILICPGRGTERFAYTTIAEDLASHGFVVVSVDMPGIGYVNYANGYVAKPFQKFKPPPGLMAGPYEKVDAFFEKPTAIGVRDLAFVFNKLRGLNKEDPTSRFTGRMDLANVGVFGHSLGGRIGGAFVAVNPSVKAYIAMEGIPPRDIRYQGKIEVPSAMLVSSGTYPYAKVNYDSLIDNRSSLVYMIELVDFGHNSVTDFPQITPSRFNYKINAAKALRISREIVTSFFRFHLSKTGNFERELDKFEEVRATIHPKP